MYGSTTLHLLRCTGGIPSHLWLQCQGPALHAHCKMLSSGRTGHIYKKGQQGSKQDVWASHCNTPEAHPAVVFWLWEPFHSLSITVAVPYVFHFIHLLVVYLLPVLEQSIREKAQRSKSSYSLLRYRHRLPHRHTALPSNALTRSSSSSYSLSIFSKRIQVCSQCSRLRVLL